MTLSFFKSFEKELPKKSVFWYEEELLGVHSRDRGERGNRGARRRKWRIVILNQSQSSCKSHPSTRRRKKCPGEDPSVLGIVCSDSPKLAVVTLSIRCSVRSENLRVVGRHTILAFKNVPGIWLELKKVVYLCQYRNSEQLSGEGSHSIRRN